MACGDPPWWYLMQQSLPAQFHCWQCGPKDVEIERLRADLETAERALDAQTDFRAEISRLRALLATDSAAVKP